MFGCALSSLIATFCLGSLVKCIIWLLSVLVAMVGEADNGKTIQNIVKMPVSGCFISYRNKFLVQLPVLPVSLAKNLAVCGCTESYSFFLLSAGWVSSMPARGNHRKMYILHCSVMFYFCEWHKRHVTWESSNSINNDVC